MFEALCAGDGTDVRCLCALSAIDGFAVNIISHSMTEYLLKIN